MTPRMGNMDNEPRDLQAIMEASNYIRHGCLTRHGLSRSVCICPKAPCGGVAAGDEDCDCPEHGMRNPLQYLHWAAECPGPYARAATSPQ